jgi:hypothetical protein
MKNKYKICSRFLIFLIFIFFTGNIDVVELIARTGEISEEAKHFLKIKELLFEREWNKTRLECQDFLKDYPGSKFEDEVLYWFSESLNKLSFMANNPNIIISLKENAIKQLNLLIKKYPESVWKDDALTLNVEIAGYLALMGKKEHEKIIKRAISSQNKKNIDLKMIGLDALIDLKPDVAIPILKKIVENEKNPSLREKGILILRRHFSENAVNILKNLVKKESDRNKKAAFFSWLYKFRILKSPAYLNFYVFSAGFNSIGAVEIIKDRAINLYDLPPTTLRNSKKIKKTIQDYFNNSVFKIKHEASILGVINTNSLPYCSAHEILIRVSIEGLSEGYDHIIGEIKFYDQSKKKEFKLKYLLGSKYIKLFVFRKKDKLAILALQFEYAK